MSRGQGIDYAYLMRILGASFAMDLNLKRLKQRTEGFGRSFPPYGDHNGQSTLAAMLGVGSCVRAYFFVFALAT